MKGIFETSLGPVKVASEKRYMVVGRMLTGAMAILKRSDQIGEVTQFARSINRHPRRTAIVLDTMSERELTPQPDQLIKSTDWTPAKRRRKTDPRGPRKTT